MICVKENVQNKSRVKQQSEATRQRKFQMIKCVPRFCQNSSKRFQMNMEFNIQSEQNYDPIARIESEHQGASFLCIGYLESKHNCVEGIKKIKDVIREKHLQTTYNHVPPELPTCTREHRSGPSR